MTDWRIALAGTARAALPRFPCRRTSFRPFRDERLDVAYARVLPVVLRQGYSRGNTRLDTV
ncbi:hypothetical protein [Burkholderia paludis]|nr:hypothetical protein [Burkholderia paludis]